MDGDVEAVRGQAEQRGNQFPREGNGVLLEVVADAEVAQHFEKSEVLMVAHLVDVGGPKTLLRTGQPAIRGGLFAHEEWLERHHTGAGKQQSGIACRYQRCAGHVKMVLTLEEPDVRVPYFVAGHQSASPAGMMGVWLAAENLYGGQQFGFYARPPVASIVRPGGGAGLPVPGEPWPVARRDLRYWAYRGKDFSTSPFWTKELVSKRDRRNP